MITDDQVIALFAKANPVPSLDLVDPIEPVSPGHLKDPSERSREMSEVKTIGPRKEARRIRWAPVLVTALVAVAAVALLIGRGVFETEPATPVEVAEAYVTAVNDRDFEAAASLFAPGTETSFIEDRVGLEDWELFAALGLHFEPRGCRELPEDGVVLECALTEVSDLTRVLGLAHPTKQIRLLIEGGHITNVIETRYSVRGSIEALRTFNTWVKENHPGDVDTMMHPNLVVKITPEAIALWEQYTDEFVAEMEES